MINVLSGQVEAHLTGFSTPGTSAPSQKALEKGWHMSGEACYHNLSRRKVFNNFLIIFGPSLTGRILTIIT